MQECDVLWGPGIPWGISEKCVRDSKHDGDHSDRNGFTWSGRPTREELNAQTKLQKANR